MTGRTCSQENIVLHIMTTILPTSVNISLFWKTFLYQNRFQSDWDFNLWRFKHVAEVLASPHPIQCNKQKSVWPSLISVRSTTMCVIVRPPFIDLLHPATALRHSRSLQHVPRYSRLCSAVQHTQQHARPDHQRSIDRGEVKSTIRNRMMDQKLLTCRNNTISVKNYTLWNPLSTTNCTRKRSHQILFRL